MNVYGNVIERGGEGGQGIKDGIVARKRGRVVGEHGVEGSDIVSRTINNTIIIKDTERGVRGINMLRGTQSTFSKMK